MCTYKTLTKSKHGYLIYCTKCKHYQLAFGTSLINMSEGEFEEFKRVAQEQFSEQRNSSMEWYKSIQLPVFAQNNIMVLSYVELKYLIDMIQQAELLEEVDVILKERRIFRP